MTKPDISNAPTLEDMLTALDDFQKALPVPVLPRDVIVIDPSRPAEEVRAALERIAWQQLLYGNSYYRILTPDGEPAVNLTGTQWPPTLPARVKEAYIAGQDLDRRCSERA